LIGCALGLSAVLIFLLIVALSGPTAGVLADQSVQLPNSPSPATESPLEKHAPGNAPPAQQDRTPDVPPVTDAIQPDSIPAVAVAANRPDLSLDISFGASSLPIGAYATVTIACRNYGSAAATGVRLTDTLPASLTFVSASGGLTPTVSGNQVVWELGALEAYQGKTLYLTVAVSDTVPVGTTIQHCVQASTAGPEDNRYSNDSCLILPAQPAAADVRLDKWSTGSCANTKPGGVAQYSVQVKNEGNISAQGVVLTDTMPFSTTFLSFSSSPSGVVTPVVSGADVIWQIGALDLGATVNVYPKLQIASDAPVGLVLTNTARATTTSPETDQADNQDMDASLRVIAPDPPDISVSKSSSSLAPGSLARYQIRYYNHSYYEAAYGVLITDTLPLSMTYVASSGAPTVTVSGNQIVWRIDQVPAYCGYYQNPPSIFLTVSVASDISVNAKLTNTVEAYLTGDPDLSDNLYSYASSVQSPSRDLYVYKSLTSGEAVPGGELTYTINYNNYGYAALLDVVLTDTLPAEVEFVRTSGSSAPEIIGNQLVWRPGILLGYDSGQLAVTVRVREDAPIGAQVVNRVEGTTSSQQTGTYADSDTETTTIGAGIRNIYVKTTRLNGQAAPGGEVTYRLTYGNNGNRRATGVMLTDTLPPQVSLVSTSGLTPTITGQTLVWNIGTLPQRSGDRSLDVKVRVSDVVRAGETLANVAQIASSDPEVNYGDNFAVQVDDIVEDSIDVYVTKQASSSTFAPWGNYYFYLSFGNRGTLQADGIVISDALGSGLYYREAYCSGPYVLSEQQNGQVIFQPQNGYLAPGESGACYVYVTVGDIQPQDILTNTARIETTSPDADLSNNTATWAYHIPYAYDLSLTKTWEGGRAAPGEVITYHLNVANIGSEYAYRVVVTDQLPAELSYVSAWAADSQGWSVQATGAIVTYTNYYFYRGESADLYLMARISQSRPSGTTLLNVAGAAADWADDAPANNIASHRLIISTADRDLYIEKGLAEGVPLPGEVITYVLRYGNTGQDSATGVVITDDLPFSVTVLGWESSVNPTQVAPNGLRWDIGVLPGASESAITLTAKLDQALAPGDVLVNRAGIATADIETGPRANLSSYSLTVIAPVGNLVIMKSLAGGDSTLGNRARFFVGYKNSSTLALQNVVITDTLPDGMAYDDAQAADDPPGWTRTVASSQVTWSRLILEPGQGQPVYHWVDTSGGTSVPVADDVSRGPYPIGFTFNFFGQDYTEFYINTNGQVLFGQGSSNSYNYPIPNPCCGNNFIAALWDDLKVADSNTQIRYKTFGVTPHRYAVIEFAALGTLRQSYYEYDRQTFAIILYEGSNDVVIQYKTLAGAGDGRSATVGIENADGTRGVQYVYNGTGPGFPLRSGTAVRFVQNAQDAYIDGALPVSVLISPTLLAGTPLVNTVEGTTSTPESSYSDNRARYGLVAFGGVPDLKLTKSLADNALAQGADVAYNLTVENLGPQGATDIVLTDTLPVSATFVAASDQARQAGNQVVWQAPSLPAYGKRTFVVTVTIPSTVPVGATLINRAAVAAAREITLTNNQAEHQQAVEALSRDLGLSMYSNSSFVQDVNVTYGLDYRNYGSASVSNVVLTDTLPLSMTFVSANPPPTQVISDRIVVWHLGRVPAYSGSRHIDLVAYIPGEVLPNTVLVNEARITTSDLEVPDYNANYDSESRTVAAATRDLAVSKYLYSGGPIQGTDMTYLLYWRNYGNHSAANVVLTDTLPLSLTFVSQQSSGWTFSRVGNALTWQRADVPAYGYDSVYVTVRIPEATPDGAILLNQAHIRTSDLETDYSDNAAELSDTVVAQRRDVWVTKSSSYAPAPGEQMRYQINFGNDGNMPAADVVISDTLPDALVYDRYENNYSGWTFSRNGQILTWRNPTLTDGYGCYLYVYATIAPTATIGSWLTNTIAITTTSVDIQPNNDIAVHAMRTVTPTVDLELSKDLCYYRYPDYVCYNANYSRVPGSRVTYRLSYANTGNSMAHDVRITDTLPISMTYDSYLPGSETSGWTRVVTGNQVTWTRPTLARGASGYLYVSGVISPTVRIGASLTNIVEASSSDQETYPADNRASHSFTVIAPSLNLYLFKRIDAGSPIPGNQLTYQIFYYNQGNNSAQNVVLTDTLPLSTTFIAEGHPAGWALTSTADGQAIWNKSSVGPGESGTLTVTVRLAEELVPGAQLINRAEIRTSGTETNNSDNIATSTVSVEQASYDLRLLKWFITGGELPGALIQYGLRVENRGNRPMTGIVLTDTLSEDLIYVAGYGAYPANVVDSHTITWSLDALAPGASTSDLTLVARVTDTLTTGGYYTNTAIVAGIESEASTNNNLVTVGGRVVMPDLSVRKAGPNSVFPGAMITYTIVYTNYGNKRADNARLIDQLPGGVDFISATGAYSISGHVISWELGNLVQLAGGVITLTGQVNADAVPASWFTNQVSITCSVAESNYENNVASVSTQVIAPDLWVVKELAGGEPFVGQVITYAIRFGNRSGATAPAAVLTDDLPSAFDFISATGVISFSAPVRQLVWMLGELPVGASGRLTVTGRINVSGIGTDMVNRATISSQAPDAVPSDNSSQLSLPLPSPDLRVAKSGPYEAHKRFLGQGSASFESRSGPGLLVGE
jgi:uncharacterized repeat protein (TIGR01451 family)